MHSRPFQKYPLPRWLRRVEEREQAIACERLKSAPALSENTVHRWHLHFYPELRQLHSSNFTFSGPLWLHSLLSPVVTVPIHPVRHEDFFTRYGLHPDEVLQLVDEGRVVPIIDCDIHRYSHPSRSYLRPLVAHPRAVSTATRSEIAYFTLAEYEDIWARAARLVPERIPLNAKDGILGTMADWVRWFGRKTGSVGFRKATIERLARLMAVAPDTADHLAELAPDERLLEIHFRAAAEIHPATKGLGGIYKLTDELLVTFAHRLIGASARVTESRLPHVFSVIAHDLEIRYPETLSFRGLQKLLGREPTTVAQSLTMALLERARARRPVASVTPEDVLKAWKEVGEAARRLEAGASDVFNIAFEYALSQLHVPAIRALVRAAGRLMRLDADRLDDLVATLKTKVQEPLVRRAVGPEDDVIWLAFRYRKMVAGARANYRALERASG